MDQAQTPIQMEDLRPGDHICCMYWSDGEYWHAAVEFAAARLDDNDRVVIMLPPERADGLLSRLTGAGVGVAALKTSAQLVTQFDEEAGAALAALDAVSLTAVARRQVARAKSDGYGGLGIVLELPGMFRHQEEAAPYIAFFTDLKAQLHGTTQGICVKTPTCHS